jgi:hypothetical protein
MLNRCSHTYVVVPACKRRDRHQDFVSMHLVSNRQPSHVCRCGEVTRAFMSDCQWKIFWTDGYCFGEKSWGDDSCDNSFDSTCKTISNNGTQIQNRSPPGTVA